MLNHSHKTKRGDCDACPKTDIDVFPTHHGMVMCAECRDKEIAAVARSKEAVAIVETARKVDTAIELKQDVFNATTVSFIELQTAIGQDDAIPADQKDYRVVKECADRIDRLTAIIFAEEAALMAKKEARHAWLVQTQNLAAKLRADVRGEFKQYDVNYNPQPPKSSKPKAVKAPSVSKKMDKTAVFEAAKKYGVPAAQVQGMVISLHISPDEAGRKLKELL